MSIPDPQEIEALRAQLEALTRRVAQLEAGAGSSPAASAGEPQPGSARVVSAKTRPAAPAWRGKQPRTEAAQPGGEGAPSSGEGGVEAWTPTVWIAAAGALLFLLGAAYFLYWSIEQGYIGPAIRVAIGCGAAIAGGLVAVRTMKAGTVALGGAFFLASIGTWTFSLYYASAIAEVLPLMVGFGGTVLAVLVAALLAARFSYSALMGMGYALGLAAPVVFSTGSNDYPSLAAYLLALLGFSSVVFYRHPEASEWTTVRFGGLIGTWLLLLAACGDAAEGQRGLLLAAVVAAYAASALWIWIPRGLRRPSGATGQWILSAFAATGGALLLWPGLDLSLPSFGAVLFAQSAIPLVLLPAVRRRLGDHSGDLGLATLALVHAFVAIPVVWDSAWVATSWSLLFATLAYAAIRAGRAAHPDRRTLAILASIGGAFASLAWAQSQLEWGGGVMIGLNDAFASGLLCGLGWLILSAGDHDLRGQALAAGELVVHLTLGREVYELARSTGATDRVSSLAPTILFAISGAAQWLASVRAPERLRGLAPFSYLLLGLSAAKLLLFDLQGVGSIMRALATLGVASVFLLAAFLVNRAEKSS